MVKNKILNVIIMLTLILILGLWLFNFNNKENYLGEKDIDDSFYLSNIRTRDLQDVISITESQLIETS
jgi:hypothetical protein